MHNNVNAQLPLDPSLSAEALANLADQHPDLWAQILVHPNTYPALQEWIVGQAPTLAPVATVQPSGPHPVVSSPGKSKGAWKWVGIGAGAIAALALVGAGAWWFFSQGAALGPTRGGF